MQVLIQPLLVILSLMEVVVVKELLIVIVPPSHIIKLIHGLSQLTFHYALSWIMDTSTLITSIV